MRANTLPQRIATLNEESHVSAFSAPKKRPRITSDTAPQSDTDTADSPPSTARAAADAVNHAQPALPTPTHLIPPAACDARLQPPALAQSMQKSAPSSAATKTMQALLSVTSSLLASHPHAELYSPAWRRSLAATLPSKTTYPSRQPAPPPPPVPRPGPSTDPSFGLWPPPSPPLRAAADDFL
jgi:hypothetical protein